MVVAVVVSAVVVVAAMVVVYHIVPGDPHGYTDGFRTRVHKFQHLAGPLYGVLRLGFGRRASGDGCWTSDIDLRSPSSFIIQRALH